jgi:hypothetical protein
MEMMQIKLISKHPSKYPQQQALSDAFLGLSFRFWVLLCRIALNILNSNAFHLLGPCPTTKANKP